MAPIVCEENVGTPGVPLPVLVAGDECPQCKVGTLAISPMLVAHRQSQKMIMCDRCNFWEER